MKQKISAREREILEYVANAMDRMGLPAMTFAEFDYIRRLITRRDT
jgi:hypothetical protein